MERSGITFERWIQYIFDHPVTDPAWHWNQKDDFWQEWEYDAWTGATTVRLLTETFERAGNVLQRFSDAQVNQGLWLLIDPSCSDYAFSLLDEEVPWSQRRQCIRSIYTLFKKCFVPRCSPHLSHLDEPNANPLNTVCYMWWDVFPAYGQPDDPGRGGIDAEFLNVMKMILELDSDACCESALHGLGHWCNYYAQAATIIDEFLAHSQNLRRELKHYAAQARRGYIL